MIYLSQRIQWGAIEGIKLAGKTAWLIEIPFDPLISQVTQAFSDMLCLETLSHGTSLPNYLNIRVVGADPNYGGREGGSSHGLGYFEEENAHAYCAESARKFHVFKDSKDFPFRHNPEKWWKSLLRTNLAVPILTKTHAFLSGLSTPAPSILTFSAVKLCAVKLPVAVLSILTPSINCRFIPEDLDRFENDPDYGGMAWRTTHKIGIHYMGLLGVLTQGFRGDVLGRIKANPLKAINGVARLTLVGGAVAGLVIFGPLALGPLVILVL